jgi:UDP-N-acetylmuramate--alanine ligase
MSHVDNRPDMIHGHTGSVHFVGIGGIGLSGLARLLRSMGWTVSGSDRAASPLTDQLAAEGISVTIGHDAKNIGDAELVVISSAIPPENPELAAAQAEGRTVVKRDELISWITRGKRTVAIAGTHGKTTTTAMTGICLEAAGFDPTVIVGGIVPAWSSNVRLGRSDMVVIEADEYDHMFWGLHPEVAVVTTIEMDHPDIFADLDDVIAAFRRFLGQVQPGGLIVAHRPDAAVRRALEGLTVERAVWHYGLDETDDWTATGITGNGRGGNDFFVRFRGRHMGTASLAIPGQHNVTNALAALAVTHWLTGEPRRIFPAVLRALAQFSSAERRLQQLGSARDVLVVDDYAHHPTEVRATLAALREQHPGRTLWAVFQPHTFSRTRALLDQFAACFDEADHVLVTDIYAAREVDDGTIHARALVERMNHPDARYLGTLDNALAYIVEHIEPEAIVVTLGAGDVTILGPRILKALEQSTAGGEQRNAT